MIARHIAQHERAGHVVPVVLERLGDALAHGLEAGEVDDRVDVVRVEDAGERVAVEDVVFVEHEAAVVGGEPGDGADAFERHFARVAEVVHHHDVVSAREQFDHRVAADESRAARHEHAGVGVVFGEASVCH